LQQGVGLLDFSPGEKRKELDEFVKKIKIFAKVALKGNIEWLKKLRI